MGMNQYPWKKSNWPSFDKPSWKREDFLRGGSIERSDGEYIRRNWIGDVTFRRQRDWDWESDWDMR